MDWQQIAALVIVTLTACLFLWQKLRSRRSSLREGTRCGCGPVGHTAPREAIVFRARKGERLQVVVRPP